MAKLISLVDGILTSSEVTTGGTGGGYYTHNQIVADTIWYVTHNLGHYVDAMITDSGGNVIYGDVQNTTINTLTITFSVAISGSAYCN